jgi:predicted PurR-regulated permease PerM
VTVQKQFRVWAIAMAVTLVLLWLLSDILLPFVAGLAVAYFLDPVADRMEKWGMSRIWATSLITVLFFILFTLAIILLVPLIGSQISALAEAWPTYVARVRELVDGLTDGILSGFVGAQSTGEESTLPSISGKMLNFGTGLLQNIASKSVAFLNFVGLLFITPVVSFYLLNDWDRIIAHMDSLLPRGQASRIRTIAKEIDQVLAGFVRGMGTVCFILAIFYATALSIAGLEFGLVVGLIAGLISFIPFVGMAVGLAMSMVLAVFQFLPDRPEMVAVVFVIFIVGQVLEGNFLTPKLVGKKIGLHPVWVIFGLLALGSLFGFVGMLIAVPIAAAIGVLVRHATAGYLESPLYWGEGGRPIEEPVKEEFLIADTAAEESSQGSDDI